MSTLLCCGSLDESVVGFVDSQGWAVKTIKVLGQKFRAPKPAVLDFLKANRILVQFVKVGSMDYLSLMDVLEELMKPDGRIDYAINNMGNDFWGPDSLFNVIHAKTTMAQDQLVNYSFLYSRTLAEFTETPVYILSPGKEFGIQSVHSAFHDALKSVEVVLKSMEFDVKLVTCSRCSSTKNELMLESMGEIEVDNGQFNEMLSINNGQFNEMLSVNNEQFNEMLSINNGQFNEMLSINNGQFNEMKSQNQIRAHL
ncbi:unnamed protein product [Bursaphelenchus xylophilus]|uniref:(pine wood nematode) hypothetical protein n=1 Tax=Bursaphelenchus xylophilus TaxID=6326 RepID=A0A1I7RIR4_BURXY|nr:unnamed protein product [Bursaphelenchus xylophilus]CAG9119037.1 unnamed protein product [Bursaphelenchus xylophilus]